MPKVLARTRHLLRPIEPSGPSAIRSGEQPRCEKEERRSREKAGKQPSPPVLRRGDGSSRQKAENHEPHEDRPNVDAEGGIADEVAGVGQRHELRVADGIVAPDDVRAA
ncbi:MAG: hypothetical protein ACR2KV_01925 [Solirubrobacteraceae bacterium]